MKSLIEAISTYDILDALTSAKRTGAQQRHVKNSATKKVIQLGYAKWEGFKLVVTPKGEDWVEKNGGYRS